MLTCVASSCAIDDRQPPAADEAASDGLAAAAGLPSTPDATIPTRISAPVGMGLPAAAPSMAGVGASLELSVARLDLGQVVVGQMVPGMLTIRNAGDATAAPLDVALSGTNAADFSVAQNDCAEPLAAGATCWVSFGFNPSSVGDRSATALLSSGTATGFALPLSGVGLLPGALTALASAHDFGGQELGAASEPFAWTITNSGSDVLGALTLTSAVAPDFVIEGACTGPLQPGMSCTLGVRFVPSVGGPRSQTLEVQSGTSSVLLRLAGRGQYRLSVVTRGNGRVQSADGTAALDCGTTCSALFDPGLVPLEAHTTNGSSSFLSGWSVPGCGPSQTCSVMLDRSLQVTAEFAAMTNNLVFVTSEAFPATLGSASAYDAACNRLATAAGINSAAGTGFIAAVSGEGSFFDRMSTAVRGWVRLDGLPFANLPGQLVSGQFNVYHGVHYTERGTRAPDVPIRSGTFYDGTPSQSNCRNWTDGTGAMALAGSAFGGPSWLWSAPSPCSELAPVYCLGVSKSAELVVAPAASGKRLWVSTTPYVPGSMTPDAKCRAERPAGVADAVALVAYTDRPASAVLDPAATYVRPDGQRVGTGAQLLELDMVAGPWVLASGAMSDASGDVYFVWTGSADPTGIGSADGTCSNWSSAAGVDGQAGGYGYDDHDAWDYERLPCSVVAHLYCVEP